MCSGQIIGISIKVPSILPIHCIIIVLVGRRATVHVLSCMPVLRDVKAYVLLIAHEGQKYEYRKSKERVKMLNLLIAQEGQRSAQVYEQSKSKVRVKQE